MAISPRLYKNALELLYFYNSSPSFRVKFKNLIESRPNVYYKGIKLKDYVKTLTQTNNRYILYRFRKINPETIDSLFTNFYRDTFSRRKLEKSAADYSLTEEDLIENRGVGSIGRLAEGKEKEDAWSNFLDKHADEKGSQKPLIEKGRLEKKLQTRQALYNAVGAIEKRYLAVKNSKALQSLSSKGQILTSRLIEKASLSKLTSVFTGALSSMVGLGGEKLLSFSFKTIDFGSRALSIAGASRFTAPVGLMRTPIFWMAIGFLGLILVLMPGGLLQSSALLPPYITRPTAVTTPAPSEVELTKSGPTLVRSESDLPYQLTITYKGSIKKIIRVADTLPKEVDFKSASDGGVNNAGVVEWNIDMDPGTTKTLNLLTFVKPLPAGSGEITIVNSDFRYSYTTPRTTSSGGGLGYNIPFKDSSVTIVDPDGLKAFVLGRWPTAQLQHFDNIVTQAKVNGWNPAFVIALWIEESGAQGEIPYDDPLGCDPLHPTTSIDVSLKCLFNEYNSYDNSRFADFMCRYSEFKTAPCEFKINPNFPEGIRSVYSRIVPSGAGAITSSAP